jgi:methionyl-tRNA synthetase
MSALKEGVTPKEIIDRYHHLNDESFKLLGIEFDVYSRTSLDVHTKTAQEFFLTLYKKGCFYPKTEKQLYSEKEQRFLADRFVIGTCPICGFEEANGDQCEQCGSNLSPFELKNPKSKMSGDIPVVKETTQLYFKLSAYQKLLEEWIGTKDYWKPNVINYCSGWFKTGLQDRAVTRDLEWGVPVPLTEFKDKKIYVWIEAPVGYVSATKVLFSNRGEADNGWKRYWQSEDTKLVHFIGKDNIIFHAIVFPAMLMAHGDYVLPDNVPANEFLNFKGEKFSKSRGHVINVKDAATQFNPDCVRYTIASNLPENKDSDFYWTDLQAKNNNELAAILGNFVNRTMVFAHKYFEGKVPETGTLQETEKTLVKNLKAGMETIAECYENYRFKDAVTESMNIVRDANKYFNDTEPWKAVKTDKSRCGTIINTCLQLTHSFAVIFNPVLPFTSKKILDMLGTGKENFNWSSAGEFHLASGHKLNKPEILFKQIEDSEIEK